MKSSNDINFTSCKLFLEIFFFFFLLNPEFSEMVILTGLAGCSEVARLAFITSSTSSAI